MANRMKHHRHPLGLLGRSAAVGWLLATCSTCSTCAIAGELPNTGGKLDFGVSDLPIPRAIVQNITPAHLVEQEAQLLRAEKVTFRRVGLITDLGQSRHSEAVPVLEALLSDPSPTIRAAAAEAIVTLCDPASIAEGSRKAARSRPRLPPG